MLSGGFVLCYIIVSSISIIHVILCGWRKKNQLYIYILEREREREEGVGVR